MKRVAAAMLGCMMLAGAFAAEWSTAADGARPAYTADGLLKLPESYREWIFLSSGLDMSYSDRPDTMDHSMFDNVFVGPDSYREFLRTGTWPDGTQLVLENRVAAGKGSINQKGQFQSEQVMGVEVHVKDVKRFQGGWGFFAFRGGRPANEAAGAPPALSGTSSTALRSPAKMIPLSADCYSCHQQHAAVDTTFVQFYPTLLNVARAKGTLLPR